MAERDRSRDRVEEYDNEVLHHLIHLLSEPDYQIPYEDYEMLLQKYQVLTRVLNTLHEIHRELRTTPPDEHTDVLLRIAEEYDPIRLDRDYVGEGFNGELIEPAIVKVQKALLPADIIIGLFTPNYVIPRVDSKILRKIQAFIYSILDEIGPPEKRTDARVNHIRGVTHKYIMLIPNFSYRDLPDVLARLERRTSPYSQDKNGGKSKKRRKNKRYTRR
jgi:hypothetical protein